VNILTPAQITSRKRSGWKVFQPGFDISYKSHWNTPWFFIREFYQNALDEHDEAGHPASRPSNHVMMVAKRRRKLQVLASRLPRAETYGPTEGNVLLIGWGSSHGPIREAVDKARAAGESVSALNIRYIQPLQPGIGEILEGFNHIFVVELNDEGLYGYGQLAGVLRARFCNDKIRGINKTDGLPLKVREVLDGMHQKLKQSSEATLARA